MQENEFEKQVKELMENFHVVPSQPVWNNIKKQLKEKRRHAWPLIFLLLLVSILSGAIIFFNDAKHSEIKQVQIISGNKKENDYRTNVQPVKKDSINQNEQIVTSIKHQISNNKNQTEILKIKKENPGNIDSEKRNEGIITSGNHQNLKNKNSEKINNNKQPKISDAANNFIVKNDIKQEKSTVLKPETTNQNEAHQNAIFDKNVTANVGKRASIDSISIQDKNSVKNLSTIVTSSTDDSTKKDKPIVSDSSKNIITQKTKKKSSTQKNKNNKLQFCVAAFVGKSNISNYFLNLNDDKSINTVASPVLPGNSVGDTNNVLRNLPSKLYSSSTSFGFGFTMNKSIAKHLYVSSGLNYLYLSATTKTGSRIDSSVSIQSYNLSRYSINNYYRNGEKNFTNSFHFIELPIYFKQDFIHSKKITVSYNAGFSVMQLIAAHALIYDATKNVFYSQNSLLNHTQFQLLGGLNFQFNLKNKTAVSVAPHVSYSLSGFSKNTDNNKLHYSNYGLQLNWMFKK